MIRLISSDPLGKATGWPRPARLFVQSTRPKRQYRLTNRANGNTYMASHNRALNVSVNVSAKGNSHRKDGCKLLRDVGVPYGNRTRVAAVKGRCPRPLDERDRQGFKLQYIRAGCQPCSQARNGCYCGPILELAVRGKIVRCLAAHLPLKGSGEALHVSHSADARRPFLSLPCDGFRALRFSAPMRAQDGSFCKTHIDFRSISDARHDRTRYQSGLRSIPGVER